MTKIATNLKLYEETTDKDVVKVDPVENKISIVATHRKKQQVILNWNNHNMYLCSSSS